LRDAQNIPAAYLRAWRHHQ